MEPLSPPTSDSTMSSPASRERRSEQVPPSPNPPKSIVGLGAVAAAQQPLGFAVPLMKPVVSASVVANTSPGRRLIPYEIAAQPDSARSPAMPQQLAPKSPVLQGMSTEPPKMAGADASLYSKIEMLSQKHTQPASAASTTSAAASHGSTGALPLLVPGGPSARPSAGGGSRSGTPPPAAILSPSGLVQRKLSGSGPIRIDSTGQGGGAPHNNSSSGRTSRSPSSSPLSKTPKPSLASVVARSTLVRLMVLRKILLLNDGRDKVLKCAQYSAKVMLWLFLTNAKERFPLVHERASKIASQFSLTRKIVRLGQWLDPLSDHLDLVRDGMFKTTPSMSMAERTVRILAPFNAWIGIINGLADDVICYSKMGILTPEWGKWATPISDRAWFITIFIDINENMVATRKLSYALSQTGDQSERQKISDKMWMQRVSLVKLLMDLCFCSIDVFELGDRVGDGWQACTGFGTALLSTYKLYVKHR